MRMTPFFFIACNSSVAVLGPGPGGQGGRSASASATIATTGITVESSVETIAVASGSSATGGGNCAFSLCGKNCVDLASDAANCGACYHLCGGGEICTGGACQIGGCISAIEAEDDGKVKRSFGWNVSFGSGLHAGKGLETWSQV